MTAEETLDLLRNSLDLLETHPPVYKIPNDRPHSGEKDCGSCGYPLTGGAPNVGSHEDYVSDKYHSNRGKPCDYLRTVKRLQIAVEMLATEANEFDSDVERRDGPCGAFKPQYTGTDYCECLWTRGAHASIVVTT